jgi:hypothetical protein
MPWAASTGGVPPPKATACVADKKMPPTRGSAAVEEDRSIRLIKCLLKHYTFIV